MDPSYSAILQGHWTLQKWEVVMLLGSKGTVAGPDDLIESNRYAMHGVSRDVHVATS